MWPELAAIEGAKHRRSAGRLMSRASFRPCFDGVYEPGEVLMVAGVSDRHLKDFGGNAFRHYSTSVYCKICERHFAEISFEACEPDAELGLHQMLRIGEIE